MQIVIDIPGEIRKGIFDGVYCGIKDKRVSDAIKNGIPLEEGHGRLIDADEFHHEMYHRAFEMDGDTMWNSGCWVRYRAIEQVLDAQPTIIEADEG